SVSARSCSDSDVARLNQRTVHGEGPREISRMNQEGFASALRPTAPGQGVFGSAKASFSETGGGPLWAGVGRPPLWDATTRPLCSSSAVTATGAPRRRWPPTTPPTE